MTGPEKLEEAAQPRGLVTDLTPGVAVGTGAFSLAVGFKKSKIEKALMDRKEVEAQEAAPAPFLKTCG